MPTKWKCSLVLSLGVLVLGVPFKEARGGDGPRQPTASSPETIATTRTAAPLGRGPVATLGRPVATLDRPVPLVPNRPLLDQAVRPTAYSGWATPAPAVFRGQAPDGLGARPLPAGPAQSGPGGPSTWRAADSVQSPAPMPSQELPMPTPQGIALPPGAVPPGGFGRPVWSVLGGPCGTCGECAGTCPTCDPGCCDPGCCDGCYTFGNRFFGIAEYLLWWTRGSSLPPLVTAGSLGDTVPGAFGLPGTSVLFGNQNVGSGVRSGGRFRLGYWFTDDHALGVEIGGFFLGNRVNNFSAMSFGSPILARPFIDAMTGMETVELVAAPNTLAGIINVRNHSSLWGYQANLRRNLCCGCNYYVDALLGYRGLGLDEGLDITENLTVLRPGGGTFLVNDSFRTHNRFYGTQVGLDMEFRRGRWSLGLRSTVALGPTQQLVQINGSTVIGSPLLGTQTFPGGLLAQPSNMGRYVRDTFTVVPEVGVNVGYQFTNNLRGFIGYNFLYWSSVVRPGNQIDRVVNTNQIPPAIPGGPARPAFAFNGSDFWAQGLTFGLEFRY